mgnify:FL=1
MKKVRKDVVSLIAYILGVSKSQIEDIYGYSSIFQELHQNSNVMMARACCIIRTSILTTTCSINMQRFRNILHNNTPTNDKYVSAKLLFGDKCVDGNMVQLHGQYDIITQLDEISCTLNYHLTIVLNEFNKTVRKIPIDYILDFFDIKFSDYNEITEFKSKVLDNMQLLNKYPFKRICNLDMYKVNGNILATDNVFLQYIYSSHNDVYNSTDYIDELPLEYNNEYDTFLSNSDEKIIAFVDCENMDYAKVTGYLKSLPEYYVELFEQVVLVDDCEDSSRSIWSNLQKETPISIVHKKVDRVVDNKSVNDFVIYTECFKLLLGNEKRLMILASDSDYLPLITQFKDRTIIGYEPEKASDVYLSKLKALGVPSFNVHDKCTDMASVINSIYNTKIIDYLNGLQIDYDYLCNSIARDLYLSNMTRNQKDSINDIVNRLRVTVEDGKLQFYTVNTDNKK